MVTVMMVMMMMMMIAPGEGDRLLRSAPFLPSQGGGRGTRSAEPPATTGEAGGGRDGTDTDRPSGRLPRGGARPRSPSRSPSGRGVFTRGTAGKRQRRVSDVPLRGGKGRWVGEPRLRGRTPPSARMAAWAVALGFVLVFFLCCVSE